MPLPGLPCAALLLQHDWQADGLWPYARGLPDAPQARAEGICDRGDEDYHSSAPEAVARSGIPERRLYDQVAGRMAGEGGSGMKATIWHNPNCGTSRKTLEIGRASCRERVWKYG